MTLSVHVRYFAAAADAAGVDEEHLALAAGSTIADLSAHAGAKHGAELSRVLGLCTFLLDGQAAEPGTPLATSGASAVRVDVLPPFAGG